MLTWKITPQIRLFFFFFTLILSLGLFFVILVPYYQGPDEQIHYATVQHRAEPLVKNWPIHESENHFIEDDIASFHLSEETIQSAKLNQFDEIKWQNENTQNFLNPKESQQKEMFFEEKKYSRFIDTYPSNASGTTSFYYSLEGSLERFSQKLPLADRFFLSRLFSLFLYLGIIIITYLFTKKYFSSFIQRVFFVTILAFQPMLLATGTIVNIDIALIFSFTLFFWVSLKVLEKPAQFYYHPLLFLSFILALYSKGPGITLLPIIGLLYLFLIQKYFQWSLRKSFLIFSTILLVSMMLFFLFIPQNYISSILHLGSKSHFNSPISSLLEYKNKTLSFEDFRHTHTSYWGNFGWLDTKINPSLLTGIWIIEILAWLGITFFLLSKKVPDYLPKKYSVIFALIITLALQLSIRFYDWRVFDTEGKIVIGTPGRYFLPTLLPHLLILVTGLGFLFTKNKNQFTNLLKILALGMILLCLYSLFNVIIPRYYL